MQHFDEDNVLMTPWNIANSTYYDVDDTDSNPNYQLSDDVI